LDRYDDDDDYWNGDNDDWDDDKGDNSDYDDDDSDNNGDNGDNDDSLPLADVILIIESLPSTVMMD
jgi:hypothetical protein